MPLSTVFATTTLRLVAIARQSTTDCTALAESYGTCFFVFAPAAEAAGRLLGRTRSHEQATRPPVAIGLAVIPVRRRPTSANPFILVGRLVGNDLVLPAPGVSRLHAIVRETDDGLFLEDAGSRNGTSVNDVPVPARDRQRAHRLSKGDVVSFGGTLAMFVGTHELAVLIRHARAELDGEEPLPDSEGPTAAQFATEQLVTRETEPVCGDVDAVGVEARRRS